VVIQMFPHHIGDPSEECLVLSHKTHKLASILENAKSAPT
jgi:hypothetical protein